jgi:hypothetical protein
VQDPKTLCSRYYFGGLDPSGAPLCPESSYAASSPGAVGNLVTGLSAFAVFFAFLGFFVVVVVVEAAAFFESTSVGGVEVCVWVETRFGGNDRHY